MTHPAPSNGREHTIKLLGSTLHYWVYGPNKGAPIIIAIHGFRGTHHGLERIVEQLPGYTIISPDLPGFGDSSPMKKHAHDIDGYAALFEKFIPIVVGADEPYYLLGHSFGSIIAAKLAASKPKNLMGQILIDPIADRPKVVSRFGAIAYFWLGHRLSEDKARKYYASPRTVNAMSWQMTKTWHGATRAYVREQHLTHFSRYANKLTLRESFNASVSRTVGEYASRITTPTLLIAGEKDEIAPLKSQYVLSKRLAGTTELAVIKKVGHLIHYEKAPEAAELIRAFVERASLEYTATGHIAQQ